MTQILTCPFCGSHPQFVGAEQDKGLAALVHCIDEDCYAHPSVAGYEDKQAIAFWNRRAAPRSPQENASD